jgi:hypothetical protein
MGNGELGIGQEGVLFFILWLCAMPLNAQRPYFKINLMQNKTY